MPRSATSASRAAMMASEPDPHVDVLLVDDDRVTLLVLSRALEAARMRVMAVESAEEALRIVERVRPEVVVADVSMPTMDGHELCRRLRSSGHADIPFLFCSARDSGADRVRGLSLGADDYVVKPVVPEELVLRVRLQLTKSQYMRALKTALSRSKSTRAVMSGRFGGISVADVLQSVMALARGTYAVALITDEDRGEIYLSEGRVIHAETGWVSGPKALFRMLDWQRGQFEVNERSFEDTPTIDRRLDDVLLDMLSQLDMFQVRRAALAAWGSSFEGAAPPEGALAPLRAVYDLAAELHALADILDHAPMSDLETAEGLILLLQQGSLRPKRERVEGPGTYTEIGDRADLPSVV